MFFHDHAYGLTRLNVYAGEAAGYLLVDPAEENALAAATAPGTVGTTPDLAHLIALVIQDKTFVPSTGQVSAQDPTWVNNFGATPLVSGAQNPIGGNGDLWFPHVYMTNQNPADPGGANGFGRWDYGPWFFPPQSTLTAANPPSAVTLNCTSSAYPGVPLGPSPTCPSCGCPIILNPSGTPEGFMDTPVVNGVAYPVLHVAPAAYRFRILSAGNDRSWNLSWFLADATGKDVAMVPAVPPATGSAIPLCPAINPVAIPSLDMGLATGLLDASTGNPLNGTGLPANCWPNYGPQPGIPAPQTMWAADGRAGGAPDPRNAGPAWIQIGSEGGLLPAPVVIPPTAVNYEQNTRSITVTNVAVHGLWLGPAERSDVIVDFSQFAGKTLILYNDAPTPAPGFDSRLDYFTGDGDQTPIGGAPNTPPGYGPNTRTVMQVIVDANNPNAVPFSFNTLKAAFASTTTSQGVFAATQPTTIVPETAYNSAYNANFPNIYAAISANTLAFTPIAPLTLNPPVGLGDLCSSIALSPGQQCATLGQKTIQELFTLDYGRMNATLGTELPLTNFTTQTTIPLGYVDPPTEIIRQGDTQLWKITHNGVDTHFIHFHLFNVQVVNRMGWDGTIRPPDQNELGWKDTVRMNPLEDILVALQPITPSLPFPIPNSIRNEDVTGATLATSATVFTNLDPFTGQGATTINGPTNYGWEYVWHCHILGHEENDMMRPIVFQVPPPAPSNLVAANDPSVAGQIDLSWTDNSANETGFIVQRTVASDPTFTSASVVALPGVAPSSPTNKAGEGTSWGGTIRATDNILNIPGSYIYRVQAVDDGFKAISAGGLSQPYNSTGPVSSTWSNTASAGLVLPNVTFTGAPATAPYSTKFTVTATTNAPVVPQITATGPCAVTMLTGATPTNTQASVLMTSGTGQCVLTATWAGSGSFAPATLTQTTAASLATPTTTFVGAPLNPPGAPYNSTFSVTAGTNAGVTPTISGTAGICSVGTVSGTSTSAVATVTMLSGTGTCTVTATWQATANYAAAVMTQSATAVKLNSSTTLVSLSPNPAVAGQPVTASVRVASATALTSGATGPAGTVTVTGGGQTCTATLTAGSGTTPSTGTCTLTYTTSGAKTITATYNGNPNFNGSGPSASLTEQVRDFGMTPSPTSQTVNGNQKATYTVTITSLNGFTGPVVLSCAGTYPSTYSCSVSPTSATLTANGSVNVTLTVNTAKGSPGTYTVTITGKSGTGVPTSGGLTHTATVSIKTNSG
jgi:VCBS repeat-containing protein